MTFKYNSKNRFSPNKSTLLSPPTAQKSINQYHKLNFKREMMKTDRFFKADGEPQYVLE